MQVVIYPNASELQKTTYQARVLVCADGATSKLGKSGSQLILFFFSHRSLTATQLGIVKDAPNGTCSRAFVEGGTHNLKADGVVFYNTGYYPNEAKFSKETLTLVQTSSWLCCPI